MKLYLASWLVCALATADAVGASSWFGKAVYNKWHETELERWLSDHGIPYPSPADRKNLENAVKSNWGIRVQKPFGQISDQALERWENTKEWIFDTWTDSQLKAFLDRHSIPSPQPRRRDVLLKTARENYESIAKKLGEAAHYPGNWLYDQWTESDLKLWLDERGWPAPQPTTRDQLIAAVRRNTRIASLQAKNLAASVVQSANAAQETLSEALFNAWSDSDLKKFLDEHDIHVPQGSKRNELVALARKHRAALVDQASSASSSASDYIGAATSRAGNEFGQATDNAELKAQEAFDTAVDKWSDSRLKAFLDARGIPVPQKGKRDELLAKVRLNKHKAATGWNAWTFDTWDTEQLKKYLASVNSKVANRAGATRDELLKEAQSSFNRAAKAGGSKLDSATSYIKNAMASAKDATFDSWSHSDLKEYLDSYGVPVYQGTQVNELRATARRNAHYFKYGTSTPQGALYAKLSGAVQWAMDQLKIGAASGRAQGQKAADNMKQKAGEAAEEIRSEL
ncbi:double-strand break repair enhancer MSC1 [Aspergillus lucknowensis]|uniref:Meiotic sister chromatid recombination protein Ish1/Msc1 n=1 Tax=Aspergillus lucknowensis TaxID=176173 RepID=A0ABR4LY69_9EURO